MSSPSSPVARSSKPSFSRKASELYALEHDGSFISQSSSALPIYGSVNMTRCAPKTHLPEEPVAPRVAKQIIKDELNLDGNPRLNMASFVTTFMEPEAEELMLSAMKKNFIDLDEYQATAEMHLRCVNMIANMYHAPPAANNVWAGTGTVGSSEAIMLATLAMKWKWRSKRQAENKAFDKPNMVFGANVQVCWHKACKYFDIECREADVSPDCLVLTAERAKPLIDENTIGVCPILGSTFNGEFEDVKGIHDMVVALNKENGWNVPVHVDAASGGFIAPFIDPDRLWDFRLPNVKSINVSGHKFGLVYAGVGWVVWREAVDLPDDLIFHINYLGGDQASFTLNFSKGASQIIGQYYNLVRYGFKGYQAIMQTGMMNASYLRDRLRESGLFNIVDKGHMPLVAFSLKDTSKFSVFDIQDGLKREGWIVPAYTCPKGAEKLAIMRVVVKQNFSHDMANLLLRDIQHVIEHLTKNPPAHNASSSGSSSGDESEPSSKKRKIHHAKSVPSSSSGSSHHHRHHRHRHSGKRTHGVC
eukprot:TRINITY_DN2123_c0_g1_i1.p1 TRINITY_DN2123_c0_g1~~TRINITY_DN2123_c0_g1_i1.p1  ORF type:complete len:531 (-),score=143.27 TRINITY_DN2123_c0_g1_i1:99-1691(-)